jgi:hypothetical protein
MIAVLGEHKSDAETLVAIVKRLLGDERASILRKGYSGCGELCRKGKHQLRQFAERGARQFIVAHDADGPEWEPVREKVLRMIVRPAEVEETTCIVIPVQELEAWMLADEKAVARVIPSFKFKAVKSPELQKDPKEHLVWLSRDVRAKPRYVHAVHNPRIAEHLDFDRVSRKCPSFRPLRKFVEGLTNGSGV